MRKVAVAAASLVILAGAAAWAADDEEAPVPPPSAPAAAPDATPAPPAAAPDATPPAAPAAPAAPDETTVPGDGTTTTVEPPSGTAPGPTPPAVAPADTNAPAPEGTPAAPQIPQESVPASPTPGAPVNVTPPPPNTRPKRINVNPPPPALPPLQRTPISNAAATTGAVTAKIPVEPLPPFPSDHGRMHRPDLSDIGYAAFLGGGYENFTNSAVRNMTTAAGAWDARIIGGTRSYVGFEAAYVGAARSISALGLGNNSSLVSNGFEGAFRLNVPVARAASLYEPFAYVGLGYSRYSVTNYNVAASSDLASGDGVMTVPFGAGFAYGYKAFIADARVDYTPTFYSNLFQATNGTGTLNHWGFGGHVGISF